jgi:hypothetical protein
LNLTFFIGIAERITFVCKWGSRLANVFEVFGNPKANMSQAVKRFLHFSEGIGNFCKKNTKFFTGLQYPHIINQRILISLCNNRHRVLDHFKIRLPEDCPIRIAKRSSLLTIVLMNLKAKIKNQEATKTL